MSFKHRLKKCMEESNLKQTELAEKIFVSKAAINNWLAGKRSPDDPKTYLLLASVLNTSPAYLFFGIRE